MNILPRIAALAALALGLGAPSAPAQTAQSPQAISDTPHAVTEAKPAPGDKPRGPAPLAFKDCLRPERVRGWTYVANDELLVDAGRKQYRITLATGCSALSMAQVITRFEAGHGTGRMCGMPQDYIHTDAGRCKVAKIELIDRKYYDTTPGRRGTLVLGSGHRASLRESGLVDRYAADTTAFDFSERAPRTLLASDR